ncbi:MAG: flagellar protein FliT [Burkholderiales bacterium]
MTKAGLTAPYQKVLALSEKMLASAQTGDWENLLGEGNAYFEAVRIIQNAPIIEVGNPEKFAALISCILDNDAKIKSLIKARMDDLHGAMGSVSQSLRLNAAYHP